MSGATKRLYLVLRAHCVASDGGDDSFLPIGEVHPREFAELAGLHPGAARKIRGRLEGARLLTIGLEGWFLPFEEGQARHNIPRTVPLSTASPKKAAETRHTIPSKEGNAPLSTVTIYSIKEGYEKGTSSLAGHPPDGGSRSEYSERSTPHRGA